MMIEYDSVIKGIQSKKATVELFLVGRKDDNAGYTYTVYWTTMHNTVANDIRNDTIKQLQSIHKKIKNNNINYAKYDPTAHWDRHVIEFLPLEDVKVLMTLEKKISTPRCLKQFLGLTKEFLCEFWAYCIRITWDNATILLFRKSAPSRVLTRGKLAAVVRKDYIFSKCRSDLFVFDGYIDCLVIENTVYIIQRTMFERIFGYLDEYEFIATAAFKKLNKVTWLSKLDRLKRYCESDSMKLRKLNDVLKNNFYLKLNFSQILDVKKKYKRAFSVDMRKRKIYAASPKEAWDILKLLSDDLLHSELTENRFEVHSKEKV